MTHTFIHVYHIGALLAHVTFVMIRYPFCFLIQTFSILPIFSMNCKFSHVPLIVIHLFCLI